MTTAYNKFYINGEWVEPAGRETIDVINPATEEAFATISMGTAEDVDAAAKAARAVILEPIMKLEVLTPEENMGDIVGDLNRRRGQVTNMDDRAGAKVIKATVPLSEMFGYVTALRTMSSGRATSTMEFDHYEETPSNISEEVIKKAKGITA